VAVADGEHEVGPDEQVDLAELDLLDLVQVAGRPQDHEQGVAVALELGPLVGDDGVLDGQLVQAELLGHGQQLGLGRPEQPDPGHRARLVAQPPGGLGHGRGAVHAPPAPVDGGGDDALLHRRRRGGGPGLHRHLGRRRLPLAVGAAGHTPVREQHTRTPLGHD
jgi:hypothetical protein